MKNLLVATVLTAATAAAAQNAPFVQCLQTALSNDTSTWMLPNDPMFLQGDVHPYNLNYNIVPAAISFPKTQEQVSEVVKCANAAGVAVQARSGGHSYANYALGGFNGSLVVDMKNMASFSYNEGDHTVTFGPGNLLGNISEKLLPLKRVMAYGEVAVIGTGGHLTIGGLGTLSRQLGVGADQIVSAQCVLANGTAVTASASTNPDLFFAIRGAGFSFAIVTEFTMKTAPAPTEITKYAYTIAADDANAFASTFQKWQKFGTQKNLDRRFSSTMTLSQGSMVINGNFYGPKSDFDKLNAQSILPANTSTVVVDVTVGELPFPGLGDPDLTASGSFPIPFYAKSVKTPSHKLLSDKAIKSMFSYINGTEKGAPVWLVIWDLEGGAIADVPQTATAYWHRDAAYFMQSYVVNLGGPVTDASKTFLSGLSSLVQKETCDDGAYPGYVDPELSDPQRAYWGGNVQRLQQIKAAVDPDNVFRNPQSVPTQHQAQQRRQVFVGSAVQSYAGQFGLLASCILLAAILYI
ncbi:uncharacterized protein J4E88_010447 [Alternaria novae-zelandiae]|uniref:uncharacterized protein n=1 Tax=Alternaria novae-zelandiae TaxID=430562 RepID=UPI0020C21FD2|nr:uncharacterized protein J4E88_010447 [Alternaria novae-zelandiae]KAI4666879.1 hypothetical protein J4E88_010447 [Alternaria novae-zelandiae]